MYDKWICVDILSLYCTYAVDPVLWQGSLNSPSGQVCVFRTGPLPFVCVEGNMTCAQCTCTPSDQLAGGHQNYKAVLFFCWEHQQSINNQQLESWFAFVGLCRWLGWNSAFTIILPSNCSLCCGCYCGLPCLVESSGCQLCCDTDIEWSC